MIRTSGTTVPAWLPLLLTASCGSGALLESRLEVTEPLLVDSSLRGALEVGPPRAKRLESGKLELSIPLRNTSEHELDILLRVCFCDAEGNVIPYDETPRQRVRVPQGLSRHSVVSYKSQARRFRVRIEKAGS